MSERLSEHLAHLAEVLEPFAAHGLQATPEAVSIMVSLLRTLRLEALDLEGTSPAEEEIAAEVRRMGTTVVRFPGIRIRGGLS